MDCGLRAVAVEDRVVLTRDGVRIAYTRYTAGHDRALLIAPGFLQHRRTRLFRALARRLADDHDVITMDFRGHGQSGGCCTFSACETQDLQAVLDAVRPRYRRLTVLAFSLGTVAAIDIAAHQRTIDRLILVSPPMRFDAIENCWWVPGSLWWALRKTQPGWPTRLGWWGWPKPCSIDLIARVAPTPVCLLHGTRDPIVRLRHSQALYAVAGEPKRLEIVEGGLHAETLFAQDPEGFVRRVRAWSSDADA